MSLRKSFKCSTKNAQTTFKLVSASPNIVFYVHFARFVRNINNSLQCFYNVDFSKNINLNLLKPHW